MAKAAKVEVPPKVNKMVQRYIQLRDKIAEIKETQRLELAPYDDMLNKLSGMMLQFLDETGQESAKTDEGTVYIRNQDSASLADPEAFMEYVRENDAYELMDRRANKTACREFAEEHGSMPPGVKFTSIRTTGVRSPTK
jgi:hypothetical protein